MGETAKIFNNGFNTLFRNSHEPCGCGGAPTPEEWFGEWSALMVSQTIAISVVMFLLSLQILFHKGEVLVAGPWLWRRLPIPFPWLSRVAERFKKLSP